MFSLSRNSMVGLAREYWQAYLPARYQRLHESGQLHEALTAAAEKTLQTMQRLHEAGMSQWEAWEATREIYLMLPKEPGVRHAAEARKSALRQWPNMPAGGTYP